jgi:hypothetical protein
VLGISCDRQFLRAAGRQPAELFSLLLGQGAEQAPAADTIRAVILASAEDKERDVARGPSTMALGGGRDDRL